MLVGALRFQYQPVAAHLIPDPALQPVLRVLQRVRRSLRPVADGMKCFAAIDRLAALGTGIVTLSGGEPLLHPDLDEIIRRIRAHGAIATLITNGYLLSRDRIARLNRAGLDHLQISIDNVMPDEVSKKSLKVLDQKLRWLAEDAEFDVTVNSVVGGGHPESGGCADRHAPRACAWVFDDGRDHSRRRAVDCVSSTNGSARSSKRSWRPAESVFDFANYNRFQKNLAQRRSRTTGTAAPAAAISTSAKTASCTGARSSEAIPAFRWSGIGAEDLRREYHQRQELRAVLHRRAACIGWPRSTSCAPTHRRRWRSGSHRPREPADCHQRSPC